MKEVEVFIGPCSKYITGQGWTTEVPVEQIKAKGYRKREDFIAELTVENYENDSLKEKLRLYKDANEAIKRNAAELQKQVEYLTKAKENALLIIEQGEKQILQVKQQAVKDTAKEIYSAVLEFCPVHNDGSYSKFISLFEEWLKHKYGVEVE